MADARPNFWESCTQYDLRSGQVNGKVFEIVNGTVTARRRGDYGRGDGSGAGAS